jgi:CHAT domain-containing protein/Tfp pilus assembly protein PilF
MLRAILVAVCLSVGALPRAASAAPLAPSADPVAAFLAVADSLSGTGDAGLGAFVKENSVLAGASVASLLDAAFLSGRDGDTADEKARVELAARIASLHEANGGTSAPRLLVESYRKWTPAQRATRQRAIDLEAESGAARKAGELDRAVSLLDQARALYEKIGDRHSVAVNWGSLGVAHWGTGDYDLVLADYEKALEARRAVEDRILEGRTLNGLGSTYLEKGELEKSADCYRQAVELRRRTADAVGLGTSLTYLGNVLQRTGRLVEARTAFQEAVPILESLGRADQMVDLHIGLANLASDMGRIQDANASYRIAIDLAAANQLTEKEISARLNLADNFQRQGRYADATAQLDAIEPLLEKSPLPAQTVVLHRNRGMTAMKMGDLDRARDEFLACAELAGGLDDPQHAIEAQLNIGYLYRAMGAPEHGLKSAVRAVELSESAANARAYREAVALRAELERMLGRYDDALASWREALAQDEADQASYDMLQDRTGIATNMALLGDGPQAREQLRSLLPEARATGDATVVYSIEVAIGHTFEAENADSAAERYEAALRTMEDAAVGTGSHEARAGYLSGERRYYYEEIARFYASTAASTRDPRWSELAFHTIERAKARGLLDMLQAQVAGSTSADEAAVLDELYSLDPADAGYAAQKSKLEARYDQLRDARIRTAVGGLAAGGELASLSTLVGRMPKKTAMVAYALGDSASLAWVIDGSGFDLRLLPPRSTLSAQTRRLRDAISLVEKGRPALLESSRALYRMLLEPFEARLAKARTVIIVPDGALFEIPFEALLVQDAAPDAPWRDQPFLARRTPLLYAPSATVYLSMKAAPAPRFARDLFAMGNPDYAALEGGSEGPLAPLPYAEQEVEAIGAKLEADRKTVLTGPQAKEKALKAELQGDSPRVLHLATHGLVDAAEPARSSVVLAPGEGEDGYYRTLEILSTRVPGALVVMSACESARGRVSRGEGVVGLSRAFLAAGAGSVVASLWSVSDQSTARLMKTFYERMFSKKEPAARALNEARIALLEDERYSHPFFWSPFIVTGTERAPW